MEYMFYAVVNHSLDGLFREQDRKMLYRVSEVPYLINAGKSKVSSKPYVIKDKSILLRSSYVK